MTPETEEKIGSLFRDAAMLLAEASNVRFRESQDQYLENVRIFYERVKEAFPART